MTKAEKKIQEMLPKKEDMDKLPSREDMRIKKDDWRKDVMCYKCNKLGHFAAYCPEQVDVRRGRAGGAPNH